MTENKLPDRKYHRLRNYDYSGYGIYYITICTADKKCVFGKLNAVKDEHGIVTEICFQPTEIGKYIEECWNAIPKHYPNASLEYYTVMPNHFHGIIILRDPERAGMENPQGIKQIIPAFKSLTTKKYRAITNSNDALLQRSYYDEIIVNNNHYDKVVDYILGNRAAWLEGKDEYNFSD